MRSPLRKPQALAAVAVAITVPLVLASCTAGGAAPAPAPTSTGTGSAAENVTLTFLVSESPNLTAEYWDAAIKRATEKVPGVTIQKVVGENTPAYAQQLFESGQAPDIFATGIADGLAQKGKLAEYTRAELEAAGITDFTSGTIGGKFYGVPTQAQSIPLVFYNKDLFTKAGISAAPMTYAELVDACKKLKAAGINAFEIGGGGKDTWAAEFALVAAAAADVLTQDPAWFTKRLTGEVKFSDPNFVGAAKKVQDLMKAGYNDPAGMTRPYADLEQAFLSGKAAMYPMGSWYTAAADKAKLTNMGVFGWPSEAGKAAFPTVTGAGMNVNAESKNLDLAKKWALAFATDKENLDQAAITDGSIITVKDYTYPDGLGPLFKETIKAYVAAAAASSAVPAWANITGDGALPPGFAKALEGGTVDLLTGKKSPEDYAKYLDEQYDAALQQ